MRKEWDGPGFMHWHGLKRRTTIVLLVTYVITTLTAMVAWFWLLAKVVLWIIELFA